MPEVPRVTPPATLDAQVPGFALACIPAWVSGVALVELSVPGSGAALVRMRIPIPAVMAVGVFVLTSAATR